MRDALSDILAAWEQVHGGEVLSEGGAEELAWAALASAAKHAD